MNIPWVTEPSSVARFLRHQGEPTEAPPRAPARAPPYFQSRAVFQRADLKEHLERLQRLVESSSPILDEEA